MQSVAYAFFDVDDTLIRTKSMFSFYAYWCEEWLHDACALSLFEAHFNQARAIGSPREKMNRDYYRFFAGVSPQRLTLAGAEWAKKMMESRLFFEPTVARLHELMRQGVSPVFVSGSFCDLLNPIAEHLGVMQILATQMQIGHDGVYDGNIGDPQTIGEGKAVAVRKFLAQTGGVAMHCWAFGDDVSDVPMLECVGHPVAVGSNPDLCATALSRRWPVLPLAE